MGAVVIERADIETATGLKLDAIGGVLGCEPRGHHTDDTYRTYLLTAYDAKNPPEPLGIVESSFSVTSREGTQHFATVRIGAGLPEDSAERKATPVFSGVMKYFPDALCEVAALSMAGNDKHNPGQPLHWAKEKSTDEDDCVIRHMLNVAKGEVFDETSYPGRKIRHRAAVVWRALAGLQREIEAEAKASLAQRTGDRWERARAYLNSRLAAPGKEPAVAVEPIEMSNGCPRKLPDTWKPIVIIESPYAGHTARNGLFLKYCERACLLNDEVPIASHRLFTEALDAAKPAERELGMQAGFELHRLADRQVVFNQLGLTPGMQRGITSWNEIHKHCRPSEFRRLPVDLFREFQNECEKNGIKL